MTDKWKSKFNFKDTLLDAWHEPWYLRQKAIKQKTTAHVVPFRKFTHDKRRPLSVIGTEDAQLNCTLLARVPGEIRNIIYLLLLGDRSIGLHRPCPPSPKKSVSHSDVSPTESFPCRKGAMIPVKNKLALLQTCRQIYVEAIEILYTSNCFLVLTVANFSVFNLFTSSILPWRLASIRELRIEFQVECFEPRHPESSWAYKAWNPMWTTISTRMTGLQHLQVQLIRLFDLPHLRMTPDTYWVKPMFQVRNLKTFSLTCRPEKRETAYGDDIYDIEGRFQALKRQVERALCSKTSE